MRLHKEKRNNKGTKMSLLALLTIRELQFRITTECHSIPIRMTKIRRLTKPSVRVDVRSLNSYTVGGIVHWQGHFGKLFVIIFHSWTNAYPMAQYMSKWNTFKCAQQASTRILRHVYKDLQFYLQLKKLEKIQMSIYIKTSDIFIEYFFVFQSTLKYIYM